jgi:hypothetical protein
MQVSFFNTAQWMNAGEVCRVTARMACEGQEDSAPRVVGEGLLTPTGDAMLNLFKVTMYCRPSTQRYADIDMVHPTNTPSSSRYCHYMQQPGAIIVTKDAPDRSDRFIISTGRQQQFTHQDESSSVTQTSLATLVYVVRPHSKLYKLCRRYAGKQDTWLGQLGQWRVKKIAENIAREKMIIDPVHRYGLVALGAIVSSYLAAEAGKALVSYPSASVVLMAGLGIAGMGYGATLPVSRSRSQDILFYAHAI